MSKLAADLIQVIGSIDLRAHSFELFVAGRKEMDSEEIKVTTSAVDYIDVDTEEKECLLVICPNDEPISITHEIAAQLETIEHSFTLYACYEISLDDGLAKVKMPVHGLVVDNEKHQLVAEYGLNKKL